MAVPALRVDLCELRNIHTTPFLHIMQPNAMSIPA